ncbi:MAG: hypothetical protein ACXWDN_16460, partial [Limisphaerales bacterium]
CAALSLFNIPEQRSRQSLNCYEPSASVSPTTQPKSQLVQRPSGTRCAAGQQMRQGAEIIDF